MGINWEIKEQIGHWEIPFEYSYGQHYPIFYEGLKKKKIMAVRCPKCEGIMLPPRPYCGRCFVDVDEEWLEMSDEGWIKSFAVVHTPFRGQPTEPPYGYALIRLFGRDGADEMDTDFHHRIGGIEDLESIRVGMRVKAVWAEKRIGNIHDIEYFEPV